ncbi:MAG: hypothetical protein IPK83_00285 [Planctomycetes bacterium]|nr:hypothetical protein [Planctomycetota bacterium]
MYPLAGFGLFGAFFDGGDESGAVGDVAQVDARELEAAVDEVDVRVDEAGEDAAAAGVEDSCVFFGDLASHSFVADVDESTFANDHGVDGVTNRGAGGKYAAVKLRFIRIGRPNFGIDDQQVILVGLSGLEIALLVLRAGEHRKENDQEKTLNEWLHVLAPFHFSYHALGSVAAKAGGVLQSRVCDRGRSNVSRAGPARTGACNDKAGIHFARKRKIGITCEEFLQGRMPGLFEQAPDRQPPKGDGG